MSLGLANHHLYLAKLVLQAWQRDRAAQAVPALTLDQAYAPGVREHLVQAYGHFLSHVLDPTAAASDGAPPRSCDDLPPQVAGKAVPGEIREFRQLEQEGWLAGLLAPLPQGIPRPSRSGPGRDSLVAASSGSDWPQPDQAESWCRRLQATFERMSDSLDEC